MMIAAAANACTEYRSIADDMVRCEGQTNPSITRRDAVGNRGHDEFRTKGDQTQDRLTYAPSSIDTQCNTREKIKRRTSMDQTVSSRRLPSFPPRTAAQDRVDGVRRAVFAEAIPLVLERGFDNVTVDDIADRAGVSRRTIFRHFPTKADIVLNWMTSEGEGLCCSLTRQPVNQPLFDRLRMALDDFVAEYRADHDWHLQIARLGASTPALRARSHERFEIWEAMLCRQIAIDHD